MSQCPKMGPQNVKKRSMSAVNLFTESSISAINLFNKHAYQQSTYQQVTEGGRRQGRSLKIYIHTHDPSYTCKPINVAIFSTPLIQHISPLLRRHMPNNCPGSSGTQTTLLCGWRFGRNGNSCWNKYSILTHSCRPVPKPGCWKIGSWPFSYNI